MGPNLYIVQGCGDIAIGGRGTLEPGANGEPQD